jgi:hypothetical protein
MDVAEDQRVCKICNENEGDGPDRARRLLQLRRRRPARPPGLPLRDRPGARRPQPARSGQRRRPDAAAEIVKSERDANGDLLVYGKATGPDLDLDGQICDPSWLKSAMPEWMEWGNVREMHQPIAAGVGVELEAIGEDWWLKSKCIDPGTADEDRLRGAQGLLVGIKNPKVIKDARAPGGRIVGGTIVEVSYVDRPCNPTAKMTICKSAPAGGDMQPVEAPETPEVGDAEAEPSSPGGATDSPAAPVADLGLKRQGGPTCVRRVRKLVPELATLDKAAPAEDIVTARQACALIAQLIVSEAQDIADGALRGSYQVGCLLDAVRAGVLLRDGVDGGRERRGHRPGRRARRHQDFRHRRRTKAPSPP